MDPGVDRFDGADKEEVKMCILATYDEKACGVHEFLAARRNLSGTATRKSGT